MLLKWVYCMSAMRVSQVRRKLGNESVKVLHAGFGTRYLTEFRHGDLLLVTVTSRRLCCALINKHSLLIQPISSS